MSEVCRVQALQPTYSGKNEVKSHLAKGILAQLRMRACVSCAIPKTACLKVMIKLLHKASITQIDRDND